MESVGLDMVAWDRERGEHGMRGWGLVPPLHQPSLIHDDGSSFAQSVHDPLYALLHAAFQDEDASYGLLLGEVPAAWDPEDGPFPGNEPGEQAVVDYLVRERGGTMTNGQPFADHGALLAEAVAEHGTDRTSSQSTRLAAHYLHSYIDTVAGGAYANGQALGEDALNHSRTATGTVIAAHIADFVDFSNSGSEHDDIYSAVASTKIAFGIDGGPSIVTEPVSWRIALSDVTTKKFEPLFGFLARDRPEDVAYADLQTDEYGMEQVVVTGNPDDIPALQRVFNAAVAETALSTQAAHERSSDAVEAELTQGAYFLMYLADSAGHSQVGSAEAEDAYGRYLGALATSAAGLVPVEQIPVVGKPANMLYERVTEAVLDQVIDTEHGARARVAVAGARDAVQDMIEQQAVHLAVREGNWDEGEDPVTWARGHVLGSGNFIRDGELMPLSEIVRDPKIRSVFFDDYIADGGASGIQDMLDRARSAMLWASDRADNHAGAAGGGSDGGAG